MDAKPTNSLAVVSLVCGIAAWLGIPILGSIAAVVTGHLARGQLRARPGAESGEGLALAGLILGYANLALGCIAVIVGVLIFTGLLAFASSYH